MDDAYVTPILRPGRICGSQGGHLALLNRWQAVLRSTTKDRPIDKRGKIGRIPLAEP